ncbi:AMP-binding protein [Halopseudomonas aestusnigri]|jgi:long-chain acyl-CoA synthetase|uniref:AMP-binding protein n=1 Tax=Halopseudomonas TaxID=2901189 RepID=UPI000C5CC2FF|nr:AMP-binding protein [Halopseudomonas aestusnigri]MAD26785.1 long-chain fatty acid--CoA ligase [Pseudomonadales bacterium]MCC4260932.1 AMP-binding protein [Halopseudomonas aestusnigri]MCK5532398.1 AMP-binding protein [Halopseudomonas aestusnigri]UGV30171.1 AMP-binding protein [Halopseudomonas aestusnigri]
MTAALVCGELRRDGEQVAQRGLRLAGGLARMGIEDGDVIAVMLRNGPAFIDAILSCQTAGCFYCPINWHFKGDEVAYLLNDSAAKVLIVEADLLATLDGAIPAGVQVLVVGAGAEDARDYEGWLAQQAPYDGPERTPRAHMAYTSGTTGRPKGVVRLAPPPEARAQMAEHMRELCRIAWGITPGTRALVTAPLYHSAPTSYAQQAIQQAETLVVMPRFDAEQTLALIEQHRIETVYLVPIMYVRLLRLPAEVRAKYDISSVRFVASTGAPCAPDVKQAMLDWWGDVIFETYASSETGMITLQDPQSARRKPGSVGRPIGDTRIRIVSEDGRECGVGEPGVIYVRQPMVPDFTYLNNEAARAKAGLDDLATVGDIGYLDADGYLYVCDRQSDMVISGGVNIYPAEIEHVLITLPGVRDCAVFGIPDAEYGESLMAVVAVSDPALNEAAIQAFIRSNMAGYKVPGRVELVDVLPRDDNGKVAKRRLRDSYLTAPVP